MLDIDLSTIDFLVTDGMVAESRDLVDNMLPEVPAMIDRVTKGASIERLYFVACGSPLCACQTAAILVDKYSDVPVRCFSGWDFLDQTPNTLGPNTLVIGVSDTGNTEEVSMAIEKARAAGAPTIAVTKNPSGNLLAEAAEGTLAYGGACIWVLHLLSTYKIAFEVIRRSGKGDSIDAIEAQMAEIPSLLQRLFTTVEESSKELGLAASSWPLIYTVSGGNLLPLGYKEGVITMMEFTWTHGNSLNASEFRHGPLEVVDKDVPYVFFLGTDGSRHTTQRCIDFVSKISDKVVVFDAADLNTGLDSAYDPIAMFVPLEFFYLYQSLGKDHNPDDRRYYGGLVAY